MDESSIFFLIKTANDVFAEAGYECGYFQGASFYLSGLLTHDMILEHNEMKNMMKKIDKESKTYRTQSDLVFVC